MQKVCEQKVDCFAEKLDKQPLVKDNSDAYTRAQFSGHQQRRLEGMDDYHHRKRLYMERERESMQKRLTSIERKKHMRRNGE